MCLGYDKIALSFIQCNQLLKKVLKRRKSVFTRLRDESGRPHSVRAHAVTAYQCVKEESAEWIHHFSSLVNEALYTLEDLVEQ
jgi:hypothetical protein